MADNQENLLVGKRGSVLPPYVPSDLMFCYIVNMLTNERINFVTIPTDLSETHSASFNQQQPMGRSAPYFTFENNEARTISFSIKLHKDLCPDMVNVVNKLKALVYPNYNGSLVQPPYCYVRFGGMVNMMAVCNSVSVNWGGEVGTILDEGSTGGKAASADDGAGDVTTFSDVSLDIDLTEIRLNSLRTATNVFDEGQVK